MRVILTAFLLTLVQLSFGQLNVELLANVNFVPENGGANDIWGYVSPDGNEYAVVGTVLGTLIYSLEDPTNPVEEIFIPGVSSIWRDIKYYGEYIYVVADDGENGLLVIDMRNAPDNIEYVYRKPEIEVNGSPLIISECHNIHIDENGIIYLAGCHGRGTDIFDPNVDPWNPPHIGSIPSPYFHDNYIKGDTLYGSQIFSGELGIYDISDKNNAILLGTKVTSSSFTHNAWTDPHHKYAFTTDERSEGFVDAYDISDPENITRLDKFKPPGTEGLQTVPHNTHYLDGYLVTSWYTEGIIIVDANEPNNLVQVAQYDTYEGPSGGFSGCWGVTPFLPSGLVLASDRSSGLMVFDVNYKKASRLIGTVTDSLSGNPINDVEVRIINGDYDDLETSDAKGEFKTGQVSEGTFLVEFYHPQYDEKVVEINLESGENVELNVELIPSAEFITHIKVIDRSTRLAISDTKINFFNKGNLYEYKTDNKGLVTANMLKGIYGVYLGKWGYLNIELEDFVINEDGQLVFEMDRGYMDDFALDLGWEVKIVTDIEIEDFKGEWERDVPFGTGGGKKYNPHIDVEGDIGNQCYITGNSKWATFSSDLVKEGSTDLISPSINLSNYESPTLEFALWMVSPVQSDATNKIEVLLMQNEDEFKIYEHENELNLSEWSSPISIGLNGLIDLEKNFKVIFRVTDEGTLSSFLIEGAVDQFIIKGEINNLESEAEGRLITFPNPVSDYVQFYHQTQLIKSVDIFDISGKLIYTHTQGDSFIAVIPVNNFAQGNYIARVTLQNEEIISSKFQKVF